MTEFKKWLDSYAPTASETLDEVVSNAWHFRDAEIAELRQTIATLREQLAAANTLIRTYREEADRLGSELDDCGESLAQVKVVSDHNLHIYQEAASKMRAEIAYLKADAERYRWLCEQNEKGAGFFALPFAARNIIGWKTKAEIDNGIDFARSTK